MVDSLATVYNAKMEKGIAFPTSISVNHTVGNYSPISTDTKTLAEGDVVKIDLGAHVDGYIVQAAHTMIATATQECVTGRKADVICAAHFAAEAALRLFRPGKTNADITKAISDIADAFSCKPIEGVLSHQLKRYVIDGYNVILNKETLDHKVDEVTFQENDIFAIDIIMSTGEGKPRETGSDGRTSIYKRAMDKTYKLKMPASRYTFSEMTKKFSSMPFTLRNFTDEKRAKLGITECVKHELVDSYPVLTEKDGEFVAQYKFTALITANDTKKITGHGLPYVRSDLEIKDQAVKDILALSTERTNEEPATTTTTAQ
eukprot:TRINITY_DN7797_c0_g1_i3.p1 TRINITY_DN7797_c0_g1~~TRINITY_DN7797_c0_g1_i3.p1  ORF type:complete len:317 (-),score=83.77 TRINITY_DN7797_c0_g1_i3:68-1018(-)